MMCMCSDTEHPITRVLQGGLIGSAPYLAQFLMTFLGGYIMDSIRRRQVITTTAGSVLSYYMAIDHNIHSVRKLFNTLGYGITIPAL